jgi:hypothetical protein
MKFTISTETKKRFKNTSNIKMTVKDMLIFLKYETRNPITVAEKKIMFRILPVFIKSKSEKESLLFEYFM